MDENKVDTEKFADTFIAFDAPEGHHTICLYYTPPMLVTECIIGGLTSILLIVFSKIGNKGSNHVKEKC